jgi:Rieske Fe-S protein
MPHCGPRPSSSSEMPCHDCLNRREFLTSAAGMAALVTVASCGDGVLSGGATQPIVPPGGDRVVVKVGDFPALANVGVLVHISETFYAAKRTGSATFDAFSMACTHEGCLTSITNGQQFDCPCHFSRFDSNGAVLRGPANRPLSKLPTSYNAATDELTIN